MPELPEVETIVRDLRRHHLEGGRIRRVNVHWSRTVAGMSPRSFAEQLAGQRIVRLGRRAKYLVFDLEDGWTLLVHLRMTGRIELIRAADTRHVRLELELEDGRRLCFLDSRKFGRWILTREPGRILKALGPEPLSAGFRLQDFRARLQRHKRQLKPLLLDQAFVAGVGNIYADEALWEARLHPQRRSNTLTESESRRLHAAVRTVLRRGIAHAGTSLGQGQANFYSVGGRAGRNQDGLRVFRRAGRPCPRCGATIRRLVVGQRGTHICSDCQRL